MHERLGGEGGDGSESLLLAVSMGWCSMTVAAMSASSASRPWLRVSAPFSLEARNVMAVGDRQQPGRTFVPDYCCGFEPATDEKTRLFSRDKIGPLLSL